MRQRCGKSVGAIDKLHGLDLLVGQFGLLGIVVWIRVNIVWSTEGSPRILGPHAVMHIENCPGGHIIIYNPIGKAIERITLPEEFSPDCIRLGGSHPILQRFLLNTDQLGSEHQARKIQNRHIGYDAVVVFGIALGHGKCLASSVGGPDIVVECRTFPVDAFHNHHCGIVGFLHLHVAHIPDGLIIQSPGIAPGRAGSQSTPLSSSRTHPGLMS